MSWDDLDTATVTARVADTVPPVEPPVRPMLAKPRAHDLVAWRHDGEVRKTRHETKEQAFETGRRLHWALVWKWAVMDGRDMIHRQLVEQPQ